MKICYSLVCWLLLLGPSPGSRAQAPATPPPGTPVQTARVELSLDAHTSEVHLLPLPADSSAVLLVSRDKPFSTKTTFYFQLYDESLHLRQERLLPVPDEFRFTRLCAEGRTVYALFSSAFTPGSLWVAAYDHQQPELRIQQFDTKLSREIVELKALDGTLFATVLLNDNLHMTALLLDMTTGQLRYVPAVYEPQSTQLTFVADAANRRAEYVLTQSNGRKSRLQLKQLTDQGQLLRSEFVQAESERNLLTAQLSPPQDTTTRLLTGTYSLRDMTYAQGLFVTDLQAPGGPDGRSPLRFYDFLRLKHFFDYLKPHREARLRQRTARRQARAVPPLRWRYRLLLHELLPQPDGGYVLVAEVYYPHYRYNTYGGFDALGRASLGVPGLGYQTNRVFDGYQTTQVLVCGFDRRGNLQWDNTFVVDNLRRYDLIEAVSLRPLPDGRLALAYLSDDKLRYKVLQQAESSPNDLAVPIQTAAAGVSEKVLDTSHTDLQPWFGSRFLASGYQRVRGPQGSEREVFFLDTVEF